MGRSSLRSSKVPGTVGRTNIMNFMAPSFYETRSCLRSTSVESGHARARAKSCQALLWMRRASGRGTFPVRRGVHAWCSKPPLSRFFPGENLAHLLPWERGSAAVQVARDGAGAMGVEERWRGLEARCGGEGATVGKLAPNAAGSHGPGET